MIGYVEQKEEETMKDSCFQLILIDFNYEQEEEETPRPSAQVLRIADEARGKVRKSHTDNWICRTRR
ncbi:MAG: hypothetical protein R2769_14165 [Saprospiraceae bacterium]